MPHKILTCAQARDIVLLILLCMVYGTSLRAQDSTESEIHIQYTALVAVKDSLPPGPFVLDSRNLCWLDPVCDPRPADASEMLASVLGARVSMVDSIRRCAPNNPRSCRLDGANTVVALGRAVLRADRAMVTIKLWFETTSERQPVAERDYRVTLQRQGKRWEVKDITVTRQT